MQSSWSINLPWENTDKPLSIAVIGDVILDEYIDGKVTRISPEAPVPVLLVQESSMTLGGAGNTARNIALCGGKAHLFSVTGDDSAFETLSDLMSKDGISPEGLLRCKDRPTIRKSRVTSQNQQLLRLDWERNHEISESQQNQLFELFAAGQYDAVLISDYGKGSLPKALLRKVIEFCGENKITCLVDPKGKDYSRYREADLITPNYNEACLALGWDNTIRYPGDELGAALQKEFGLKDILVTMGKDGMHWVPAGGKGQTAIHKQSVAREVFDVSGAGDAVVAILSLSLACGLKHGEAMDLANLAAGRVVEKWGTQPASAGELKEAIRENETRTVRGAEGQKIIPSSSALRAILRREQTAGKKVVFTNGCFDIFHAGHLTYLQAAREKGDLLVIGVNSDASIQRIKGPTRPVNPVHQRLKVLSGLACVDYLIEFDSDTPEELIENLAPDVLIKGADWAVQDIVGGDFVVSRGGTVETIELVPGVSTTQIIERILERDTTVSP